MYLSQLRKTMSSSTKSKTHSKVSQQIKDNYLSEYTSDFIFKEDVWKKSEVYHNDTFLSVDDDNMQVDREEESCDDVKNNSYTKNRCLFATMKVPFIPYISVDRANIILDEIKNHVCENIAKGMCVPSYKFMIISDDTHVCKGCGKIGSECLEQALGCYCVRAVERKMNSEEDVWSPEKVLDEYTKFFNSSHDFWLLKDAEVTSDISYDPVLPPECMLYTSFKYLMEYRQWKMIHNVRFV